MAGLWLCAGHSVLTIHLMGAIIRSPNSLPCNERRIAISRDCFLDRISQLL